MDKLEFYFSQDHPLSNAEKMKNSYYGQWRLRIGNYRLIFDVDKECAFILKIGHRKEVYK